MTKLDLEIKYIDLELIIEPNLPMRLQTSRENIGHLAESIDKLGLINPITVKYLGKYYEIIAGFRRYLACKSINCNPVPCIVIDPLEQANIGIMVAENFERVEVNTFDEAIYLSKLKSTAKLSQKEIAKAINRTESYVSERLQILNYPDELRDALYQGHISFSVARELNKIAEDAVKIQYTRYAIENGCTPEVARRWRKQLESASPMTPDELAEVALENYIESPSKVTVTMPCGICHAPMDVNQLTHIYVCRDCQNTIRTA